MCTERTTATATETETATDDWQDVKDALADLGQAFVTLFRQVAKR